MHNSKHWENADLVAKVSQLFDFNLVSALMTPDFTTNLIGFNLEETFYYVNNNSKKHHHYGKVTHDQQYPTDFGLNKMRWLAIAAGNL